MSAYSKTPGPLLDVAVLLGRSLRHSARSVDATISAIVLPLLILCVFVFVFGGAIDRGGEYLTYVVPGVIVLCAAFGTASTAVAVNQDMTTGVIDRLRSLPVVGSAVLAGHVVASVVRNVVSTAVVVAVAVALGFRPVASLPDWLAVLGLLVLFMAGVSALSAAFGLLVSSAEAAGGLSFVLLFLPYVSSGFVPPETMPAVLRGFAAHQPMTPLIESVRALLLGTPVGSSAWLTVAWWGGFGVLGAVAAGLLFRRRAR
ncbi:ABC transporter permease [Pseudonocardia oroxyli]|uniref:Transport permease protein n=1 Tax=Pseudonocardia oroxyli TaxID=366584 RepID=A0A1G7K1W6_PSEOR|nr:ABC transporter permease [Pseudonocardia oroxyli]SDF30769.1 ABC-2 type transport system permease protein [Pseudonocardia oroxyli]